MTSNDKQPNGAIIPKVERPLPSIPEESVSDGKMAVTTFTDHAQAFKIMDERDGKLIIEALLGQFSEEYIYDIPRKTPNGKCNCKATDGLHNHTRGLSVIGVREGCRLMKGIHCRQIEEPKLITEKGVEYYVACAEAVDLIGGGAEMKYYRVPLLKVRKDQGTYEDPYAYQIAQSKAERNAKSVLLPQEVVKAWIQDYMKGDKQLSPAPAQEYRNKQKKIAPPPGNKQNKSGSILPPPPELPGSESEAGGSNDVNREQCLGAIMEQLKGQGVAEKHQDKLLCKIAEHLGHEPVPKKLNEIDSKKLPLIQSWLFHVKIKKEIELNDFSTLLNEVKTEAGK